MSGVMVSNNNTDCQIVESNFFRSAYVQYYGGNLLYEGQSGALNEAFADIIGESKLLNTTHQDLIVVAHSTPPKLFVGLSESRSPMLFQH